VDEVIEFDQFKEIPERHLVFDRAIEIGDHPCSEGRTSSTFSRWRTEKKNRRGPVCWCSYERTGRERWNTLQQTFSALYGRSELNRWHPRQSVIYSLWAWNHPFVWF